MSNSPVDQFVYLHFVVKPWKWQVHEIGAFMIEFDVINDWISREIAFDVNGKPISCMTLDGADEQDRNDVDNYEPTQITRAAFETDWKKLNP